MTTPIERPDQEPPHEEECPVCLDPPTAAMKQAHAGVGLKTLFGCGHQLCWGCDERLSCTPNQFICNPVLDNKRFIRCPMCRAFEKPSYAELERERDYYKNARPPMPPRNEPRVEPREGTYEMVRLQRDTLARMLVDAMVIPVAPPVPVRTA
jgi:hypothetical protein